MGTEILLVLALVMIATGLSLRWISRRRRSRRDSAIAEVERAFDEVAVRNADLRTEVELARHAADDLRSRIGAILGERDNWARLYQRAAAEHAVAQDMLCRELDSLIGQYQALQQAVIRALQQPDTDAEQRATLARAAAGRRLRLNPAIRQVVAEFAATHPVASGRPADSAATQTVASAPTGPA